MDQKVVRKMESEIERSIGEAVRHLGLKQLPMLPSQRTLHLMAKSAVAVYEAAVENHERN